MKATENDIVSVTSEISVIFSIFCYTFSVFFKVNLKTDNYLSKIAYLISIYTSLHLITSLLLQNGSQGITLTSLTTLLAIIKYVNRPKSAAVKDIDVVSISALAISTHICYTVCDLERSVRLKAKWKMRASTSQHVMPVKYV